MADGATIPTKLLFEAIGHPVTVEITTRETYHGLLKDAEPNMNLQLSGVTQKKRDGRTKRLEEVYIRGSQVRLVQLPDVLKNAPVFASVAREKESRDAHRAAVASKSASRRRPPPP